MKKALFKDSIKEIKNTYKRFISILLMAFLGVGFFAGMRAASPDMVDTIDQYYKDNKVYDIQVLSTLGLTKSDVEAIKQIKNIETVVGTYETDGKLEIENKEVITRIMCVEELNKPILLQGELPKNQDECVVEEKFLSVNHKKIGDTIEVEVENTKNDEGEEIEYLNQSKLKIVGTVKSPLYISRDRGTSKLGAGKIDYYVYIPEDNIKANENYTNVYIKVADSEKYTTSSDKYEDYIKEIKEDIEAIKEERQTARYNELVSISTKKVEVEEAEFNKEKQNAKSQIEKLENVLKTGEELEKNKKEIQTKIAEAEEKIISAKEKIADIENPKWYILDRYGNTGYNSFIQDTESVEGIAKLFPIVFFIVALLISLTSMTRMVEEERTQIGTLKALGYNKMQIASKYVIYASLACIIGGILGMSVGFVLLPKIIWMMYQMMYQMTDIYISFQWKVGVTGLLLISICIIGATVYAVLKELVQTPATLMRPKAPKMGKRVLLEKIPFIWKHLTFSRKVTVRNIFRYKKRFLMTIIGILGCTALITVGFGIKDSIQCIMPSQFEKVFDYDMQIGLKNGLEQEQKQQYITNLQGKAEIEKIVEIYMTSSTAVNGEKKEDVQIIVPKEQEELEGIINLADVKTKQKVELQENEICLTDKAAELLGVKQGDTITLKDSDEKETKIKISNIVENYVSHYVYMSKTTYESLYGETYNTNVLFTRNNNLNEEQEDTLATEIMNQSEVATLSRISTVMGMLDDTMKSLNYVVIILIVSAGLLAFVVLYNLSNVNISERIRELATIKVLGFYDKEVYSYVARETVILTAIGIVLGLIGGYFLNYFIIGTCEINMLRFQKIIKPISYIYGALITIGFTLIVNVVTYFALKKIDMIESLKSIE